MRNYGRKLREIRGNTSISAFAHRLGITEAALQAYEAGKRIPRDEVKRRVEAVSREDDYFFTTGVHK